VSQADRVFFAQYGEDKALASIFNRRHGTCVEVGGYDGVTGSNSFYFERAGWDCLVIEPIPNFCDRIKKNRNCKIVCAAASDRTGELEFYVAEGVEMLSSAEMFGAHLDRVTREGGTPSRIVVPSRKLDDILVDAGMQKLDFVTIDVEGHELSVLRGFNLSRFNPRIVIVEDNSCETDNSVRDYLLALHYRRFRRTGDNDWFAHQDDPLCRKDELVKAGILRSLRRAKRILKLVLPKSAVNIIKGRP
jgi:FkbM family methyltransferase